MSAFTVIDLLSNLASAHGGHSQYGEAQVGFSIYGHFANGGNLVFSYSTADEAISAAAAEIYAMSDDPEGYQDCEVRSRIAEGYRAAHAGRAANVDTVALGAIIGGLPVRLITAMWDGQGAPEGAVGTMLAGRVDGRYVYGVCSGQQTEDGASCYEVWPAILDRRQMLR